MNYQMLQPLRASPAAVDFARKANAHFAVTANQTKQQLDQWIAGITDEQASDLQKAYDYGVHAPKTGKFEFLPYFLWMYDYMMSEKFEPFTQWIENYASTLYHDVARSSPSLEQFQNELRPTFPDKSAAQPLWDLFASNNSVDGRGNADFDEHNRADNEQADEEDDGASDGEILIEAGDDDGGEAESQEEEEDV